MNIYEPEICSYIQIMVGMEKLCRYMHNDIDFDNWPV
jgi:hypothetical protein